MRLSVINSDHCTGCQSCMFACSRRYGEAGLATSRIRVRSNGGVENGFVVIVCRACKDPPCIKACKFGALVKRKKGGGVRVDIEKCVGCKKCQDACIIGAISWDEVRNLPLICKYCGYCAQICPYDVLLFEEK